MNRPTPQVKGTSRMPVLTEPTPRVHASFIEAVRVPGGAAATPP